MLTKSEREANIERIKSYGDSDLPFYKLLFGSRAPYAMQYTEYLKALKDRIIDLCDTSNMIELPLDKDGEVIRIGDVVYDDEATEYKAVGYSTHSAGTNIIVEYGKNFGFRTQIFSDELTHKQPVTIESLVARIKHVMDDDSTTVWAYDELDDIATELRRLGDSDD